mmetsp:Transcript_5757/g.20665  ORF Transcript_5757/g.20665 Transcript_5757/m.20665 type:complete len:305 (+) Transcript_5757:59-973(+)
MRPVRNEDAANAALSRHHGRHRQQVPVARRLAQHERVLTHERAHGLFAADRLRAAQQRRRRGRAHVLRTARLRVVELERLGGVAAAIVVGSRVGAERQQSGDRCELLVLRRAAAPLPVREVPQRHRAVHRAAVLAVADPRRQRGLGGVVLAAARRSKLDRPARLWDCDHAQNVVHAAQPARGADLPTIRTLVTAAPLADHVQQRAALLVARVHDDRPTRVVVVSTPDLACRMAHLLRQRHRVPIPRRREQRLGDLLPRRQLEVLAEGGKPGVGRRVVDVDGDECTAVFVCDGRHGGRCAHARPP